MSVFLFVAGLHDHLT